MQLLGQDLDESRSSKVLTILLSLLFLVLGFPCSLLFAQCFVVYIH